MAKTWENYECEFFTGNTANAMGDSKYLILKNKMTRTALINFKRAPDQVLSENPAIAYLDMASTLYDKIMSTSDDKKITIANVEGDTVTVKVDAANGPFTGNCTRKPANGLCTFDFHNNNGVLSHIHVGHEVKQLSIGRPRRNSIA